MDCTGQTEHFPLHLLRTWANAKYVTLSAPALNNIDAYGTVGGLLKTGIDLISANSTALVEGKTVRWGFFTPNPSALKQMSNYIQRNEVALFTDIFRDLNLILLYFSKMKAVIDSIYPYEQLPEAYRKLEGHARGKIVVTI